MNDIDIIHLLSLKTNFIYLKKNAISESGMARNGDYTTVRIPEALTKHIDEIINHGNLGYRSRAEFVVHAIRDKLKNGGDGHK